MRERAPLGVPLRRLATANPRRNRLATQPDRDLLSALSAITRAPLGSSTPAPLERPLH